MILDEAHAYITTNFKCPHCGDVHRSVLVDINVFKKGMKTKCLNCEKDVIVLAAT